MFHIIKEGHIKEYTYILISLVFLFSPSLSYATEATYEQHIAKGISSLETNDCKTAVDEFSAALKDNPGDFKAILYLGIALSRSGDYEAGRTLKRALAIKPGDPRTSLELGIFYFNRAAYNVSRGYFENTIKSAPNSEFSEKAEEYLGMIDERASAKSWLLKASLGGQYDSNVVVNSKEGPLPQGISRKSDWSAVFDLKGRYDIIRTDEAGGSLGYSFYQTLHARLSDFNISQHIVDLRAEYRASPALSLRGAYSFEYTFVGGDGYDYAHSLSPALIIWEGKGYSTVFEYVYRKNHYMNSDLFADNSDRNGSNNLIGITQSIPLAPSVLAKLGYSYDVDSTRKDFWSYLGYRGSAGLQFTFPGKIFADLTAEYYHKNYRGSLLLSGENRKDRVYTASLSATKLLTNRYSVTAGQLYTRNRSNTPEFDYKRAITSLFLTVRF
jgi:hypothetical protein